MLLSLSGLPAAVKGVVVEIAKYIAKRIVAAVVVLVGLSIIIFFITRIMPGDPARMSLGPNAPQYAVDALNERLHYYDPLPVQYFYWIGGVLTGDFGVSIASKRNVSEDILQYLPVTLELVILAGIMMTFFSILLGVLAAWHKNTWVDTIIRFFSFFGVSFPSFVVAVLLLLLFCLVLPTLPVVGQLGGEFKTPPVVTGMMTIDCLLAGNPAAAFDAFKHLILPAVALSLGGMFQQARIIRAAMVDNSQKEYVTLEKGYGLPNRTIMGKYLLKPSLIPTVSVLGMDFASLMGGAFIVESIFNRSGLSRYGLNAMITKDLNAISGVVLVFGCITVFMNILVDLTVAYLDPRIRLSGKS
jgi:peptide/nickel transport system permease protein